MRKIAVIGAGMSGLSAAWALQRAGRLVTVFEARGEAGGRLRSDELEGVRFDAGVQLIGSNYERTFALAEACGVRDLLQPSPGRDAVWRRGSAHSLTYGSVASMVVSSALPTGLKLRLGAQYLPYLARHASGLDLHDLLHSGGLAHDQESIAAWGHTHLGSDFVELLAYPLLGAYYGSTPEQTSSALYHGLARVGLDVAVKAVPGGMTELAIGIRRGLESKGIAFRLGHEIQRIALAEQVLIEGEHFDGVVLATPARVAARLLGRPELAAWFAGVRAVPTLTLALVLREPVRADYFGLSIPRREGEVSTAVAICVQERKVRALVPDGRGALVILPAPDIAAELVGLSPEDVLNRLLPGVERVFPGVRGRVLRARTTVFQDGYTVFYPGYLHHLQRLADLPLLARVALAGDYLVAPTVEGAVRSGLNASRRLATL